MELIGLVALIAFIVFIAGLYADSGSTSSSEESYTMTNGIDYFSVKKE